MKVRLRLLTAKVMLLSAIVAVAARGAEFGDSAVL